MTIPVTLWFITKGKKQAGKTLFIDARKMGYMVDRKHRDFTEADIAKIADIDAEDSKDSHAGEPPPSDDSA